MDLMFCLCFDYENRLIGYANLAGDINKFWQLLRLVASLLPATFFSPAHSLGQAPQIWYCSNQAIAYGRKLPAKAFRNRCWF